MNEYSETAYLPRYLVTAVGSLPHTNSQDAVELITSNLKNAPHPPQLSRLSPKEQMWIQFTEGLPCFHIDQESGKQSFDTSDSTGEAVQSFFEEYLSVMEGGPAKSFAVSPEYGEGIHGFLDHLKTTNAKLPVIKVHVTGPMSFSLVITDQNQTPVFYDQNFKDVAVKGMGLKAVWLIEQVKEFADNVIIFFDEPSLSAYGSSAYLGVSREDVVSSLNDCIDLALAAGAIPGVHCCGNTDWGILMDTSTRIINFDAVDYMETIPIYADKLKGFLGKGGVLAWGAVPNDERISDETAEEAVKRVRSGIDLLVESGLDRDLLTSRIILTPACGCSGLTPELAGKVYQVLGELDAMDPGNILI